MFITIKFLTLHIINSLLIEKIKTVLSDFKPVDYLFISLHYE